MSTATRHSSRIDFLLIGAQKAGTTSLHSALAQHPSLWLPEIKELHFFDRLDLGDEDAGAQELAQAFAAAPAEHLCGESTPCYLFHPSSARHIADMLGPQTRLLILLRHPVDRAYSHYCMNRRKGYETRSFIEAFEADDKTLTVTNEAHVLRFSYRQRGHYLEQLRRYFQTFPAGNIWVGVYETHIRQTWANTWQQICQHLDIMDIPAPPLERLNTAREIRSPAVAWMMQQPRLKRLKNTLLPRKANLRMRQWLTDSAPPLEQSLRDELYRKHYAQERPALEELLDQNLDVWSPGAVNTR